MRDKLWLLSIIIIALSSCDTYRYIYTASPANSPYFTQKGESKLTGYYSSNPGGEVNKFAHGPDVQAAYAIGKHWALTSDYYNRRERDVFRFQSYGPFDSSVINYRRNLLGFGGGYFVALDKSKKITFNFYAGMAFGKFSINDKGLDNDSLNYSRYYTSQITKWFFQPSFNFMPGEHFRLSFAKKLSYVHYGNIQTSYTPDEISYFSLDKIANAIIPFVETSINFQFIFTNNPWIKMDAVMSFVKNPFNEDDISLRVRGFNASIGLTFDFSKLKKKK